MAANYDEFLGTWLIFQHDAMPPPWADAIPAGSGFSIVRNEKNQYWFIPSGELKSPLHIPLQLEARTDMENMKGEYGVGHPLSGALCIDLKDGVIDLLYFTINKSRSRRFITLSHMHATASANGTAHAADGHNHASRRPPVVNHGGSHGVDD